MKWLFIHQNFPGQFVHAVRRLIAAGDQVIGIGQPHSTSLPGLRRLEYAPAQAGSPHAFVREFDLAVQNGLSVARLCEALKAEGFIPDLVVGHSGWGETFYVKDVWPTAPLLNYFEFFYRPTGSDIDFDPEFPPTPDMDKRLRTRNAINLVGLEAADWGQTPTHWQRDQYPARYHERISVLHEGIDTDIVRPNPSARLWLSGGISLAATDEILTYSARNLEPYRGFHSFMRALPKVLQARPRARVVLVGGDGVSYGSRADKAGCWRHQLLNELDDRLDLSRIHFVGHLPYPQYLTVLQLSTVHVYLTYPFVLSWSLLEALSAGCCVVASRTPPVEEMIRDGENGVLVDFLDADAIADTIVRQLADRSAQRPLRQRARATVVEQFDLNRVCLPAYFRLLGDLAGKPTSAIAASSSAGGIRADRRASRSMAKVSGGVAGDGNGLWRAVPAR